MTRQWLSDPRYMCSNHLLGEHAETHGFLIKMQQGHSLDGFIEGGMFFGAEYVKNRHELLSKYVKGHGSPLVISDVLKAHYPLIIPSEEDVHKSLSDLFSRCKTCFSAHMKKTELNRIKVE